MTRIVRSLLTLTLLFAVAAQVHAQGVLVVAGRPKADVVQSFKLVQNFQSGYASNRSKLQTQLDATPVQYPWFFPGGYTTLASFLFDDSLIIPPSAGRKWTGCGSMFPHGTSASNWGSRLVLRALSHATFFDGGAAQYTSAGAGTGMTIGGHTVTDRDVYNSVEILDSAADINANVTPGWYGILSRTGSVWNLDRAWCTGAVSTTPTITLTNGTFTANANGWTLAGGAVFQALTADTVGTTTGAGTCSQNTACVEGKTYLVKYTVKWQTLANGGTVYVSLGGGTEGDSSVGAVRDSSSISGGNGGIVVERLVCGPGANAPLKFTFGDSSGGGDGRVEIDDVSIATAYYCPAMVTDKSQGLVHEGLAFSSHVLVADALDAQVLYHICVAHQSSNLPTGKQTFRNCGFAYSQVGILCGADMAGAYSDDASWIGHDSNHADLLRTDHCRFSDCKTAILARTLQSVNHVHSLLYATGVTDAVFNFDAGGKLTVDGVEVAGASGTQCFLRLGKQVRNGDGPFLIRGFSCDGGNSTRNPQLVVTNWGDTTDTHATVVFDGGILNRAQVHDNLPLVDVQGDCRLRLLNIEGGNNWGIWPASIRLKLGITSAVKPHVVISGCALAVTTDPEEVIDEANCDAGIIVEFFGNCKLGGVALANKTYTTTGP